MRLYGRNGKIVEMINITKVKKVFHDVGVQISIGALDIMKHDIDKQIKSMAKRCKSGNIKRLTTSTYHIAIGNLNQYLKQKEES